LVKVGHRHSQPRSLLSNGVSKKQERREGQLVDGLVERVSELPIVIML
jgi:hypothetical protein